MKKFKREYKGAGATITIETRDVALIALLKDVHDFDTAQQVLDKWVESLQIGK